MAPPGWSECWAQRQTADGRDDTVEEAEAEVQAGFSRLLVLVITDHAEEEQTRLDRGVFVLSALGR